MLEKVLAEKRVQFRDRPGLELAYEHPADTYAAFALIQPVELERIVSNLIDNAAEAIEGPGRIDVSLTVAASTARLEVRDTGRGIPADLLPRLGERGLTVGKREGSGLGLHHARTTVESLGGSLGIQSEISKGTVVRIALPVVEPAPWFARQITIPADAQLVIADDDEAIHQLWDSRLDAAGVHREHRHHARSPDEVTAWFRANVGVEAIYLCDQAFGASASSGLELIERLGVAASAILVTSHADEGPIRSRCEKFGIRIVPKSLLPQVPITVRS